MKYERAFLGSLVSSHSHRTVTMPQKFILLCSMVHRPKAAAGTDSWVRLLWVPILGIGWFVALVSLAVASHKGDDEHPVALDTATKETVGHLIPGAPFQIFLHEGQGMVEDGGHSPVRASAALQTVVEAFSYMLDHRTDYARFQEALTNGALEKVIIKPTVVNREGKEFLFLVVRTSDPSRVNLLMSASALEKRGYLHNPQQLIPVLAREFQWVVSKTDTTPKRQPKIVSIDLKQAPIQTNREIRALSGEEREGVLQDLLHTYLTTVDRHGSLEDQPYYAIGTTTLHSPAEPDSTIEFYDKRIRDALQRIVREPYFQEQTPKAVRSLLNGKIWNVAFAHIPERDWATRTRVVPQSQSITVGTVGERERTIQPARILINIYRTAAPEDPFYGETNGLPMGALPAGILARVIAQEIQDNITEKSMRGHTAQDELTAPE